jgi:pilus assembly protein Flp/PilA
MSLYLFLKNLLDREDGQDLVEYALLVGLIVLLAIAAITLAGTSVQTIFNKIASSLNGVAGS